MDTLKVLYTADDIASRIRELAQEIDADLKGQPVVALVILKGALFFAADLLRMLQSDTDIIFAALKTRASEDEETGHVFIHYWDEDFDVKGKDLLVLEDILDTGVTLDFVIKKLEQLGARSIRICCLLEKPGRRRVNLQADYVGFVIPEVYVVGYGLEYQGKYRNLPYIAELVFSDEKD